MNLFTKLIYKKLIFQALTTLKLDAVFRHLNRNKVLVVMYHGVCRTNYAPPIWTQLPLDIFKKQIAFLVSHYNVITLSDFIASISLGREIPEGSALITFDDGLRNNYSVAFPVLKKYSAPASIFLTMDFIDTDHVLWFDELYFLLRKIVDEACSVNDVEVIKEFASHEKDVWSLYVKSVETLKHVSEGTRSAVLEHLRQKVTINMQSLLEDFGVLSTKEIQEMENSGMIDFGVHTAKHRILTNLEEKDWEEEIKAPKEQLEKILNKEVLSFCYPNGRPGIDFNDHHVEYIKKCGYVCAFSTKSLLFKSGDSPYKIGRIPAGNDFTSYLPKFIFSASGF